MLELYRACIMELYGSVLGTYRKKYPSTTSYYIAKAHGD